jgi:ankyrin repeat protein
MKQLALAMVVALSVSACGQMAPGSSVIGARGAAVVSAKASNDAAFIEAAGKGQLDKVRELLAAGAKIDARNGNGYTGLSLAAWRGHAAVVEFLLDSGANPNLANEDNKAPLHWASIDKNRAGIVTALLAKGAKVDGRDKQGFTALMVAAMNNRVDTVEALIAGGADVNAKSNNGTTALKLAKGGFPLPRFELVRILEKAGAR